MSQLPVRSLRLRSYTTADLDRLSGDRGAVFYDGDLKTLKVYNGPGQTASSLAAFEGGGRLNLGSGSGAVYANQITGQITIGDYISTSGQPLAPSTVVQIGGATNAFAISAYGPPSVGWQFGRNGALTLPGDIRSNGNINIEINLADSTLRRWSFGEDGNLTFPDGTNQTTAWTGSTTVSSLVNGESTVSLGNDGVLSLPYAFGLGYAGIKSPGYIGLDANDSLYTFTTEGTIGFPGGASINGSELGTDINDGFLTSGIGANTKAGLQDYYQETRVYVSTGSPIQPNGFTIETDRQTSMKSWTFDTDGMLTLPSAGKISNSGYEWTFRSTGNTIFPTGLTLGAPRGVNTVNFTSSVNKEFQIETGTATSSRLWQFGTDGSLTIPGDVKSNGNINIDINLSDSTLRRWSFGEDGQLTFPDGTNQTTAFTGIPGPYADDAAAASAGVAVGSPYYKTGTGGQVFVRLS